ncbi:MAG: hypothetical protein KDB08_10430 [Microthrixaceae bacterium]|nr:hypothetical protein [Microthrixaceae bacterium]
MSAPGTQPQPGETPVAPFEPSVPGDAVRTAPRVPGSTGDGFQRFPTGMLDIPHGAPVDPGDAPAWTPAVSTQPEPTRPRGIAGWGLAFSIVGLVASFFVGWGFPISIVGLVTGAVALRRPTESRQFAGWALALGIAGLIYSAGWLSYAALTADLFG